MRYLWGQGRDVSCGTVARVEGSGEGGGGGVELVLVEGGSNGCVELGEAEVLEACNGVLLVGPGLMYSVMSWGMLEGVTLSINCHDGSSSTMELWSE